MAVFILASLLLFDEDNKVVQLESALEWLNKKIQILLLKVE